MTRSPKLTQGLFLCDLCAHGDDALAAGRCVCSACGVKVVFKPLFPKGRPTEDICLWFELQPKSVFYIEE